MIFIKAGLAIFLMVIAGVAIFVSTLSKSNGKLSKSMNQIVNQYVDNISAGNPYKAYEYLSEGTKDYVDQQLFVGYVDAILDEKNSKIIVDETKKVKIVKEKIDKSSTIEYTLVPTVRTYTIVIDGKPQQMKDEMKIGVISVKDGYRIYLPKKEFYNEVVKYVLGKANSCAIEALEYKNDPAVVEENIEKIDKYISYARNIPSTYKGYNLVTLEINLISGYKLLVKGEDQNAIDTVKAAYSFADTEESKLRVKIVESEMYFAKGDYASAVNVLKEALEIAPKNSDIRRDYRRINSMMIEQIESSLKRGWSQLESAIKQDEKEMKRILSDIAMAEATNAIKIKQDAPDGYYLKGNIEYCLGDYTSAIESLTKAIDVADAEDTVFKTKVAEVLGMARIAQASSEKTFDVKSYQQVLDSNIRSLIFRENEVSGIVDTIK